MVLFCIFQMNSTAQQTKTPLSELKVKYAQKSKSLNTTGWILLGTGTAMVTIGAIQFEKNFSIFNNGGEAEAILMVAGVPVVLASIPCFIVARHYKKMATVELENIQSFELRGTTPVARYIPGIKISVQL